MKIHWVRVLNAGLIAEILALSIYKFLIILNVSRPLVDSFVLFGPFVFMLVGTIWVGRKIESRFVLHGFLVGVVAIVYFVLINLPDTISGQSDIMNSWTGALIGHPPKLLGGMLGGYFAGRRKNKTA